jgi:hypothetical protein
MPGRSLVEGQATEGVVVCVHVYGLGVYLPEHQTFGHVNTPAMGVERASSLDEYPSIGTRLSLRTLGYAGSQRQLRLQVEP